MNEMRRDIDEAELHALVDGLLPDDRRAAVESAIASDSGVTGKAAAYIAQNDEIRALFGHVAGEPVPDRLRVRRVAARQRRRSWLYGLAASVAWLGIGLAGGWFTHDIFLRPSTVDETHLVAEEAVSAYRVYAVEVLHPVEVFAEQEQHLVKWLSKRIGYQIRTPDFTQLGFHLVGGRLLPTANGTAAAQFMFEDRAGRRLTLYVSAIDSGEETAFRFQELDGVSAFVWLDKGMGFAMTGEMPRERLLELSKIVYRTFEPEM